MNTEKMMQFEVLESEVLETIQGGWGNVLGAILGMFEPSPTLDQLNGKWPVRNPPRSCSPYGTGGTPNACNGF